MIWAAYYSNSLSGNSIHNNLSHQIKQSRFTTPITQPPDIANAVLRLWPNWRLLPLLLSCTNTTHNYCSSSVQKKGRCNNTTTLMLLRRSHYSNLETGVRRTCQRQTILIRLVFVFWVLCLGSNCGTWMCELFRL